MLLARVRTGLPRLEILLATLLAVPLFAQSATPASGTGLVAAPTSAAYSDLTNASNQMLGDLKAAMPRATIVILYDAPTFSTVQYYAVALELVTSTAKKICVAEGAPPRAFEPRFAPTLDFGSAASGLAALITASLPAYAIQGQTIALDNSALVGSFATAARAVNLMVVNPAYLLPAASLNVLNCGNFQASQSLADLWKFTSTEADKVRALPKADKTPLKDALDNFQKLRDVFLAVDKGPPLLARVLTVESLGQLLVTPDAAAVIDMRLDAVNIDSTTRTVLWWRKTTFSVNVAAHYWLFSTYGKGAQFGIKLERPGYANILRKDMNEKDFSIGNSSRPGSSGTNLTLPH